MMPFISAVVQIGLFFSFIAMIYAIVQVVDVIREERERLMWLRQGKQPIKAGDELDNAN